MFDVGFSEMLLLAAIALIALGPKQLPEVARMVGKFLQQFKKATSDFSSEIMKTSDVGQKIASEIENRIMQPTPPKPNPETSKPDSPKVEDEQSTKS